MNMLDYAAVAVPAGTMQNGLPWGVTLFGRVFTDQYLLSLADALQRGTVIPLVGGHTITKPAPTHPARNDRARVVVCGPPFRLGMVRVDDDGVAIEVEVWEIPSSELGSFLTGIPAPLGLGKVQLADGRWETGFICEPYGLEGAVDITEFGGWRAYMKSRR